MVTNMKMIQIISVFMVILGGLHFALLGLGINVLGMIFGGANIAIIHIVIGVSTLYHIVPMFKARIAAL